MSTARPLAHNTESTLQVQLKSVIWCLNDIYLI
jgi:hypothetical protein